jgi:hypothetical protein
LPLVGVEDIAKAGGSVAAPDRCVAGNATDTAGGGGAGDGGAGDALVSAYQVAIASGAGGQGAARVYEGLLLLLVAAVVVQEPALGELIHLLFTRHCA